MGLSRLIGMDCTPSSLRVKANSMRLFHRFSPADNTSATDVPAYLPCGAQGSELLLLRMGRAKPGKIGRSCFQVAMIAGDTGVIQSTKFIFFQQA